ncbi:TPA: AI-2E family transporter [Streptococcus suis]
MVQLFKSYKDQKRPLFWYKILNNKVVLFLLILLTILLNLLVFTKIAYLFEPVLKIVNLFTFPLVTSLILYYLFVPLVNLSEDKGLPRHWSTLLIFLFLILLIALTIGSIYPIIRTQLASLISNIPAYFQSIQQMLSNLPLSENPIMQNVTQSLQNMFSGFSMEGIGQQINPIVTSTFGGIGNVVGTVTQIFTGLVTIPIFTYYLLVGADRLTDSILRYVPTRHREVVSRLFFQGNYQVSQYIRGQIIVAVCVGIMFAIGYAIIGLEYGTTLAVTAGLLNIIPFLGSFIAVIPALIIGLLTSPMMLVKVIIVLMIEQTIEGRLISPQVLGNSLKIHPVTILIILLTSGQLFGVVGVIIGVPVYAVLKVVVKEAYWAYRQTSTAYDVDGDGLADGDVNVTDLAGQEIGNNDPAALYARAQMKDLDFETYQVTRPKTSFEDLTNADVDKTDPDFGQDQSKPKSHFSDRSPYNMTLAASKEIILGAKANLIVQKDKLQQQANRAIHHLSAMGHKDKNDSNEVKGQVKKENDDHEG